MRVAIHSGSEAVRRALATLVEAAKHELVEATEAQLLLVDRMHPTTPAPTHPHALVLGDSALPCPLRVGALLQALARASSPVVALQGGWVFDPTSRNLQHDTESAISLTEKESALLQALLHAPAAGVARDLLLAQIWGIRNEADTHTLETHLYRLRAKLNGLSPVPAELVNENGFCRVVLA